jgi:hypothetical protein
MGAIHFQGGQLSNSYLAVLSLNYWCISCCDVIEHGRPRMFSLLIGPALLTTIVLVGFVILTLKNINVTHYPQSIANRL